MDSGDKLREIVWCDHITAYGDYLQASVPTVMLASQPPTYIIVEEGKVKMVCGRCLRQALELRAESFKVN